MMIPILLSAAITWGPLAELPYAPDSLIYQSATQVQDIVSTFEADIDTSLNDFVKLCRDDQYQKAYQVWSDLQFQLFTLHLQLHQTQDLSLKHKVKNAVTRQSIQLNAVFREKLSDHPDLLSTFLSNAKESRDLTPQQRLWTERILKEYQQNVPQEGEKIAVALKDLSQWTQGDYAVFQGKAVPINSDALKQVRVLTANIICFPGTLTYLYGGISSWKHRIDRLVKTILSTEAQIVCLQEVWDPEAMRSLIDCLKDKYAYFVYDAGDPSGTLNLEKMGYSSGLFIASQIALDDVNFSRFQRSIPEGSNRGVLSASCLVGKQRVAVMTTHLQHGTTQEMEQVRKEQLYRCYDLLQKATKNRCLWGFLAGDLNVDAFSKEFDESEFARLFSVPYVANLPAEKSEKATATTYFSDLVRTPVKQRDKVEVSYELLDYCVQPAKSKNTIRSIQERIPLFSVQVPNRALSDHHALLTTWIIDGN